MSEGKRDNWKFQLFDCFATPIACVWTWCVPCGIACMQATNAKLVRGHERSHHKACLFAVFGCWVGVGYNRSRIRKKLHIDGSLFEDILLAYCCPCCSMVREWREVMSAKGNNEDELVWRAWNAYKAVE